MSESEGRSDDPGGSTPIDPGQRVEMTVRVRPRAAVDPARVEAEAARPPAERQYPSRVEFAAAHGADPADLEKVAAFAHAHGLTVEESDPGLRSVRLSGPAGAFRSAFGVDLAQETTDRGTFHAPTGPIPIPAPLRGIAEAVIGLDDRPHVRPH